MEENLNGKSTIPVWIVERDEKEASINKFDALKIKTNTSRNEDGSVFYSSTEYSIPGKYPSFFIQDGATSTVKVISIKDYNSTKCEVYFSLSENDAKRYFDTIMEKNIKQVPAVEMSVPVISKPAKKKATRKRVVKKRVVVKKQGLPVQLKTKLEKHKAEDNLYIIHYRKEYRDRPDDLTVVGIKKGKAIHIGISFCNPKDNFSKKLGVEQAFTRAIKQPIIFNGLRNIDHKSIREFLYNFTDVCINSRLLFSETMYDHQN